MHFNANNMHIYVSESPDLNPIEMLWNQLKRYVDKYNPRTKDQQMNLIDQFWTVELTHKVCNRYIDHLYKAVPICVLMGGRATAKQDISRIIRGEKYRLLLAEITHTRGIRTCKETTQ